MAAKISNDAIAVLFRVALDRVGDIPKAIARLCLFKSQHQAFMGDVDQLRGFERHIANKIHAARVAMPAIENWGDVDVDDVPVLQRLVAGDAVADDMVDRGAATLGKATIAEGGRHSSGLERHPAYDVVELASRHTGNHLGCQRVEYGGRKLASTPHPFEPFRSMELDHMAARLGPIFGADVDIFRHVPKIGGHRQNVEWSA